MSITDNTTALRSILSTVNALPEAGGGGESTVQTATGSFTTIGEPYVEIEINCGFSPDVVFIHLPDVYTEDGYEYVNDLCANTGATAIGDWVCSYSSFGELHEEYWLAIGYISRTATGFIASSFCEQDLTGDYWYTAKTYTYTAIKYT